VTGLAEQEQINDSEVQQQAQPVAEDEWLLSRREDLEPKEFAEGFTMKTVVGALFVGIVMMPGSIYLGLMMGQTIGPAAQWTTIILFTEVARRSFTKVSRQELYMIYYMAGSLAGGGALAGGAFAWLIWAQYLVQSPQAHQFGIADEIPSWYAPHVGSPAYIQRTFFHHDWTVPILLLIMGSVLGRVQWIGLGYFLFRTTSDVERLPFPFAPIAAQGATALAEVSEEKESWRWPVFSVGAMVGLVYGFFYVAIPVITSGFLADPLKLIPIPFLDLMQNTEDVFPAGRIGLATDLGPIFWGFVAPYPLIAGSFIGAILSNFVFAPTLYRLSYNPATGHSAIFPKWAKGMNLIQSEMTVNFDLFMSIGIGISLAIAVIGMYTVVATLLKARVQRATGGGRSYADIPAGRGDFSLSLAVGAWALSTAIYVIVGHALVPRFNILYFIAAAFIWTPIVSYISARMYGLTGQPVNIPYVRQATFILSGYKGIDIWFAPFPMNDNGWAASQFREVELTGTKITSVVKAEAFLLVFMLIASFAYWSFFWKTSPIPSSQYPYVQMFWPLDAFYTCLWATATDPRHSGSTFLLQAIKFPIIGYTGGAALALYLALSAFKIPVFWFYGFVGGFTGNTIGAIPAFIGALLGRYYFARRFGVARWRQYTPVLAAGYFCGVGLIGMVSIGLTIIFKAVRSLPF
jgi:hypothetical protein